MSSAGLRHGGFSLLEVLVALVVLSIGMLGIAALNVEGLRSGQTALLRTRAVALAADMADRIRANPGARPAYATAGVAGPGAAPATACADSPGADATLGACTPAMMATYDVWHWRSAIDQSAATGLPAGQGGVAIDNATLPPTFVVTVAWNEKGEARTYVLRLQP